MKPLNIAELLHQELRSSRTGESYSLSAVLTEHLEFKKLFVHHEIIPPGRRSSAPHTHSTREEMIFVLDGNPTAHEGTRTTRLRPGDFVGFRAGSDEPHFVENSTEVEAKVLIITTRSEGDRVAYE